MGFCTGVVSMALTLKKGDKVRVKPGVGTDDMKLAGRVGVIDEVTDTDYWVEFPGVGEIQFFAGELQKVKSLPATGTKAMELRAKYKAVSDTSEFRPIPNFRWNGQTWAHNGKIGTEFKTGKPTAQYNSVEVRGSRCWRNIDGVITSDNTFAVHDECTRTGCIMGPQFVHVYK
jgi:hypothetical protein